MSRDRGAHLVERAAERLAELGNVRMPSLMPELVGVMGRDVPPAEHAADLPDPDRTAFLDTAEPPIAPEPAPAHRPSRSLSIETLQAAGLAVAGTIRSRIREEWRVTSSQLLRTVRIPSSQKGASGLANVLMITSAMANEGKSFSAMNLAASLALGGQCEVLLLDIDSKPSALTPTLGLADAPGLFDLISDPALRMEDVLVPTAIPGLTFLATGRTAPAGAASVERSVSRAVIEILERLARRFSDKLLIIDTAPCLATSDASSLAATVGQIGFVVEAEQTQRVDLEAALELLRPCPNIALILNKVRLSGSHAFGDYYDE